jgi:hypothetical protein
MKNIFKKTRYDEGDPLEPEILKVNDIRISDYFEMYLRLMDESIQLEYANEWILKEYIIYYLRAPEINFPILAGIFERTIEEINLAQMLLYIENLYVYPFKLM